MTVTPSNTTNINPQMVRECLRVSVCKIELPKMQRAGDSVLDNLPTASRFTIRRGVNAIDIDAAIMRLADVIQRVVRTEIDFCEVRHIVLALLANNTVKFDPHWKLLHVEEHGGQHMIRRRVDRRSSRRRVAALLQMTPEQLEERTVRMLQDPALGLLVHNDMPPGWTQFDPKADPADVLRAHPALARA